jgi:hypothetical protein
LVLLLLFPGAGLSQIILKKPPQKPILLPQPFQPNVSDTETPTASGENPNVFSPWYDVINDLRLPDDFDPLQAAAAAATGQAEAAADAMSEPVDQEYNVPLSDLPIEDSGGSLLAYPTGTAFAPDSLLLNPGGSGFSVLSKEAALPYGESTFALQYSPRAIPVFQRDRVLTRIGPFRVGIDLSASAAYNNNVFGETNNPKGDQIYSFQPVVYLEAGTRGKMHLLYAPNFVNFSKFKELSTADQAVFFQLRYPFTKLKLGLDLSYLSQSGLFVNNDSGFVQQNTALSRLFGEYRLAPKMTLEFAGESIRQETVPGGTQFENSVTAGLFHRPTTAFRYGASLKVGQLSAPADNQTYQAARVVINYRASVALRFAAEAGIEFRNLSATTDGKNELPIPVFNFQVNYNPTSTTLFNISFYRNVLNTTFSDVSLNITTGISTSALFRLFNKVNVRMELAAGYTEQYSNLTDEDGHFYFLQGGITISYPLFKGLEIQVFDNIQQRFGDRVGNDYISNTMGFALSLKF